MITLYKRNKNQSIQQWSIHTLPDGKFEVIYGQVDGAMQRQVTRCEPKNIGKVNESTPEQQAQFEVDALIAKKLKSGYVYEPTGESSVRLPMKVKAYHN